MSLNPNSLRMNPRVPKLHALPPILPPILPLLPILPLPCILPPPCILPLLHRHLHHHLVPHHQTKVSLPTTPRRLVQMCNVVHVQDPRLRPHHPLHPLRLPPRMMNQNTNFANLVIQDKQITNTHTSDSQSAHWRQDTKDPHQTHSPAPTPVC